MKISIRAVRMNSRQCVLYDIVRAAESVVRNIAEGAGRWSAAECAKHYKIARGEAMECASSLDVLKLRKLIADEQYDRGLRLLEGVVAMLTKMV